MAEGADPQHADRVFENNCYRMVKDHLSEARIQATSIYYQQILGQSMNKKLGASHIYLAADEYRKVSLVYTYAYDYAYACTCTSKLCLCFLVQVEVPWLSNQPESYGAWCDVWASEGFKKKSEDKRTNRGKKPNHTFGSDSFIRKQQRLVRKLTLI